TITAFRARTRWPSWRRRPCRLGRRGPRRPPPRPPPEHVAPAKPALERRRCSCPAASRKRHGLLRPVRHVVSVRGGLDGPPRHLPPSPWRRPSRRSNGPVAHARPPPAHAPALLA